MIDIHDVYSTVGGIQLTKLDLNILVTCFVGYPCIRNWSPISFLLGYNLDRFLLHIERGKLLSKEYSKLDDNTLSAQCCLLPLVGCLFVRKRLSEQINNHKSHPTTQRAQQQSSDSKQQAVRTGTKQH